MMKSKKKKVAKKATKQTPVMGASNTGMANSFACGGKMKRKKK